MRRLILLTPLFLFLLALFMLGWYSQRFFFVPLDIAEKSLIITVPPNISTRELAINLHEQRILQDPNTFILFAKWQGHLQKIKTGQYRLEAGLTPAGLLEKLLKGEVLMYKLTFIEGWTFNQMMAALHTNPYLTHNLKSLGPDTVMATIGHPGENPEGMFYPDTYFFAAGTKDTVILKMAYNRLQTKLNTAWQNRDPNTPYHEPYQALIVASMVEKEAGIDQDRAQIAGVIIRRLQKQMRLQIDATVIYGLGQGYKGLLKRDNLKMDTPYNTYTRSGLPPTPIAMPRGSSIEAALHPAEGNALYYVARGDGSHIFTQNLQAHHAAVAKYLLPMQAQAAQKKQQAVLGWLAHFSISRKLLVNYWLFVGGAAGGGQRTHTISEFPSV
jgi:UPF0755 protein